MKLFTGYQLRLAILLASFAAQPAISCMTDAPLVIEDIRQADTIFVGSVVKYEIVSPGEPGSLDDYGLVTVRVKSVIKGNVSGDVQLYWWNSTFGMPDTLMSSDPALFAAVRSDGTTLPLRGASATVFPSRRRDLLQLMQAPCSEPFVLPFDQSTEQKIRNVLDGGSSKNYDPYEFDKSVRVREVPATRSKGSSASRIHPLLVGSLGLIAMVVLLASIRNRQETLSNS